MLISGEDHWFAYYWWLDDAAAPPFARTVDIHAKPGYDPVELFFDRSIGGIPLPDGRGSGGVPLDASLVRGSHGVPATAEHHRTALICSSPQGAVRPEQTYADTDVKRISLELMGAREG